MKQIFFLMIIVQTFLYSNEVTFRNTEWGMSLEEVNKAEYLEGYSILKEEELFQNANENTYYHGLCAGNNLEDIIHNFIGGCKKYKIQAKNLYGLQPAISYEFLKFNDNYLFYKGSYHFEGATSPNNKLYKDFLNLLSDKYGKFKSYKTKHVWFKGNIEITLEFRETIYSKWYSKHYELLSIEYENINLKNTYYKKDESEKIPLDKL